MAKYRSDWSAEEFATLEKIYAGYRREEVLHVLPGRSWQSIQQKASQRHLRRDYKPLRRESKICKLCGLLKTRSAYEATTRGGSRGVCRQCYSKMRYQVVKQDPQQYEKLLIRSSLAGQKRYHKQLLYKYGLSLEDYVALWDSQNGSCQICKRQNVRLVLDHDHSNGRVRSLICFRCNMAIAILEDPVWRKTAEDYIEEHKK